MGSSTIDTPWMYKHVTADTQVSAVPCGLHSIVVNGLTTTGSATIYDNTAGSGTVIGIITLNIAGAGPLSVTPITLLYDVACTTGLYIDYDATLVADLTVSYR